MKRCISLVLLASTLLPCAAKDIPSFIPADFKRATALQIQGIYAGNVQGLLPTTATHAAPSPVFEILAASWPESEVPAVALQTVQHAMIVIGEVRYRLTVPLYPPAPSRAAASPLDRLYFSVTPENSPRQVTYFSLSSERATDLARFFRPIH